MIAWGGNRPRLIHYYDHSPPREVQASVFRHQLSLARAATRPVIIHCREAWPDCLKILEEDWGSSGLGGIFHCFTGTLEEARRGMEMGFLISFAGNVTYPKAQNLRDVAREIPLEKLLIETDSPFLAPQSHRGRRNEPAYVAEVAQSIGNVMRLASDPGRRNGLRQTFGGSLVSKWSFPEIALEQSLEECHPHFLTAKANFSISFATTWLRSSRSLRCRATARRSSRWRKSSRYLLEAGAESVCARPRCCCFRQGFTRDTAEAALRSDWAPSSELESIAPR